MHHAFYQLLLAIVLFVGIVAVLKTDLLGYVLVLAFIVALMLVLRHYVELYFIGLSLQTRNPPLHNFLLNSAVTAGTAAPIVLLAIVWAIKDRVAPFLFYSITGVVAFSGLWTAYDEVVRLATFYQHFSLVGVLGETDQYFVVGAVVPLSLSIAAVRKRRPKPSSTAVRRAASALHGESNWFPIERAQRWFESGGIVIGEAYRPDLNQAGWQGATVAI
jgi:hypothetical protein